MLRPVPMVHMRIQVGSHEASAVTRLIAGEGLLHLVDLAHGRVPIVSPAGPAEDLLPAFRDMARRAERLAERAGVALPELEGNLSAAGRDDLARERQLLEAALAPLEESLESKWRQRADAGDRAARAEESLERLRRLETAGIDPGRAASLRFLSLRFGTLAPEDMGTLATLLAPAPFAIVPLEPESPSTLAAVAAPDRARMEEAFRVVSFAPIPVPESPAERDPGNLAERTREAREEEERLSREIAAEVESARETLADVSRRAQIGLLLLQAQTLFATAGRFVVISGWVPEESAEKLRRALLARSEWHAVVEIERPEDLPEVSSGALRVPILHRNPLLLRPFEKLIGLYGTPSYEEVQPTAFFAASFLLMFGLMFGDVGHGLVLFLAGYLLFRYIPRYLDYGILLMEGGAAATVFGFLYGSLFGLEDVLPALWMSPLRDFSRFLFLAIVLGVVLVSLGLILNVVNTWRAGQRSLALFGSRGLLGAFGYWVFAALAARALVSRNARVPLWLILLLLAVPLLLLALKRPIVKRLEKKAPARRSPAPGTPPWLGALESSVELVDTVVSFFANTISFLRVAAFAMVHAGAFVALFALADTLSRVSGGAPLSILALVAGNVVMIFLEGLTVSVQVLRLEYYEFFGKFFRGGGEPYRPLMLRASAAKGDNP